MISPDTTQAERPEGEAQASAVLTYIGDETSALGYRLAGAHIELDDPDDLLETFERACKRSRAVLISAACAVRLPKSRLEAQLTSLSPLVFVMPDETSQEKPTDLGARVRRELGIVP